VNLYSAHWRECFGETDAARTQADVMCLRSVLPLPDFRHILDVPCGHGRHRRALSEHGYEVVGVDNDPAVSPQILGDLRELDVLPSDFDAVINMWASFGYFDPHENERVLASLARRLRPGGRLVLDLFNRAFFEGRDGERELRPGIVERSRTEAGRRHCEIRYGDGHVDTFEWQLYVPDELVALGVAHGLSPILTAASPDRAAMQIVLAREP